MMRRTWPTMMLTVIALLGVVTVLLVTGQRASAEARFSLSSAPSNTTVVTGGSAEFQLQLTAGTNFRGTVAMATSVLPDGVQASFDHPRSAWVPAAGTPACG